MAVASEQASPGYPVRVDVPYPDQVSRWLPLVKWLLAVPHYIIIYFLRILASLLTLIAFFAILFTKRYPGDLFTYVIGVRRWQLNVAAYTYLMRDEYPPFSWDAGLYPAVLDVDYPEEMSRWLPLVKWLLAIPHYIVLVLLEIAVFVTGIISFFAILFTRRYPRSLFDFAVGVLRWSERVELYISLATDEYPPFRLGA